MAIHDDRTRMERDPQLTELNPYYGGNENETNELRWRACSEIEEWIYDEGYDCVEDPFWMIAPSEVIKEIGLLFIREGKDHAREAMYEEIGGCIEVMVDERLPTYVDGQMRLYAGYDVAENGDTLEEGDHGTWEDLRMMFEAGIRDKLCGVERYASI